MKFTAALLFSIALALPQMTPSAAAGGNGSSGNHVESSVVGTQNESAGNPKVPGAGTASGTAGVADTTSSAPSALAVPADKLDARQNQIEMKPSVQKFLDMKKSIEDSIELQTKELSEDPAFQTFTKQVEEFSKKLVQNGKPAYMVEQLLVGSAKTTGNKDLDTSFGYRDICTMFL